MMIRIASNHRVLRQSLGRLALVVFMLSACAVPPATGGSASVITTDSGTLPVTVASVSATVPATTPTTRPVEMSSLSVNKGGLTVIVLPMADGSVPSDTQVLCPHSASFPFSSLGEIEPLSESSMAEVEEAIRPFLESGEGDYWPQDEWQVLHKTQDQITLVHLDESTETTLAFMSVELTDGVWLWAGSSMGGGCALEVSLPESLNSVEWRLDPDADLLTPESTVIQVLVSEGSCASGQAMGDRLLGPEVVVTEAEVLIVFAAEPPGGNFQTCPSNPEQAVTIELSGPLGERTVVNGMSLDLLLEDILRR